MSPAPDRQRVVLLHGQPGVGAEWYRVVAQLRETCDVVAPDRPGYGFNPRAPGGVAANVEWLTELLEGEPAVVVGHSWAGSVALGAGLRSPGLIRGLVLVGSVGPGAITRMDRALARSRLGPAAMQTTFAFAHAALPRLLRRSEPDAQARRALRDAFDANHRRAAWRSFLVEQRALVREFPPLLDELHRLEAPAVVVAGTRDRVVPFGTARMLAAQIPNAELVPVARGGHLLHRTHPEVIADAVRRVLNDPDTP